MLFSFCLYLLINIELLIYFKKYTDTENPSKIILDLFFSFKTLHNKKEKKKKKLYITKNQTNCH